MSPGGHITDQHRAFRNCVNGGLEHGMTGYAHRHGLPYLGWELVPTGDGPCLIGYADADSWAEQLQVAELWGEHLGLSEQDTQRSRRQAVHVWRGTVGRLPVSVWAILTDESEPDQHGY